jgi:hypothetical protein
VAAQTQLPGAAGPVCERCTWVTTSIILKSTDTRGLGSIVEIFSFYKSPVPGCRYGPAGAQFDTCRASPLGNFLSTFFELAGNKAGIAGKDG